VSRSSKTSARRRADRASIAAADKSGGSEKKFYKRLIKTANDRFDQHVEALKETRRVDPMDRTLNE
jgi:hypothetical protein